MSKSIKTVSFLLFLLRLLKMSVSVLTVILTAKFFGVSIEKDIWVLVTTLITTVVQGVWGPINETFRAKFVFIKEKEGEGSALKKTTSLLMFIFLVTVFVSILMALFSRYLATFLLPEQTSLAVKLFITIEIVMLPTILLNELSSIGISVLNSYEVYYIPEIAGTISSLVNIVVLVLLAPLCGIYALCVSSYFSTLLLIGLVALNISKKGIRLNVRLSKADKHGFKDFLIFALPFFFPYFVGQCNAMVEKWLASGIGTGVVSSLDYARQFTIILQTIIGSILTTIMVPILAKCYANQKGIEFRNAFAENMSVVFSILGIALPIMISAAHPLCGFFFDRGMVAHDSLSQIVNFTRLYAIAFIPVVMYILCGYSLLASGKGKTYAMSGVLTQIAIVILYMTLVPLIGIFTMPIIWGAAHAASFMYMLYRSDLYTGDIMYKLTTYCFIITILCLCVWWLNEYIQQVNYFLALLISATLILILYLPLSRYFGIDLLTKAKQILKK